MREESLRQKHKREAFIWEERPGSGEVYWAGEGVHMCLGVVPFKGGLMSQLPLATA